MKNNNITILSKKPDNDSGLSKSFGLHSSSRVVVMMIKIQMGKVEDKLTNLSSGGEGIEWIKYESGRKR